MSRGAVAALAACLAAAPAAAEDLGGALARLGDKRKPVRLEAARTLRAAGEPARKKLEALLLAQRGFSLQGQEAALQLAHVGTRESLAALRAAILAGDARTQSAAAFAWRAIAGAGPEVPTSAWVSDAAKAAAAWKAWLDRPLPAPTGAAVELFSPRLPVRLRAETTSVGRGGRALEKIEARGVLEALSTAPLALRLTCEAHQGEEVVGKGQTPSRARTSWAGKAVDLRPKKHGLDVLVDGQPIEIGLAAWPWVPHGLALLAELPAGRYAPGESRPLPPAFARWFVSTRATHQMVPVSLAEQGGRLTYLGQRGDAQRFALWALLQEEQMDGEPQEAWGIEGTLEVDPGLGGPVRLDLAGIAWGPDGALGRAAIVARVERLGEK